MLRIFWKYKKRKIEHEQIRSKGGGGLHRVFKLLLGIKLKLFHSKHRYPTDNKIERYRHPDRKKERVKCTNRDNLLLFS